MLQGMLLQMAWVLILRLGYWVWYVIDKSIFLGVEESEKASTAQWLCSVLQTSSHSGAMVDCSGGFFANHCGQFVRDGAAMVFYGGNSRFFASAMVHHPQSITLVMHLCLSLTKRSGARCIMELEETVIEG